MAATGGGHPPPSATRRHAATVAALSPTRLFRLPLPTAGLHVATRGGSARQVLLAATASATRRRPSNAAAAAAAAVAAAAAADDDRRPCPARPSSSVQLRGLATQLHIDQARRPPTTRRADCLPRTTGEAGGRTPVALCPRRRPSRLPGPGAAASPTAPFAHSPGFR